MYSTKNICQTATLPPAPSRPAKAQSAFQVGYEMVMYLGFAARLSSSLPHNYLPYLHTLAGPRTELAAMCGRILARISCGGPRTEAHACVWVPWVPWVPQI